MAVAAPRLHNPRWALSLGLAAAATALFCYPAWPGFMSYDSLFAYKEAVGGIETMLWPPLHAYLFAVGRALHTGVWGLFVAQVFGLFLGANLVINLLVGRTTLAAALCLAFIASFVWIPPQAGVLVAHWRDVLTATFCLLGLAVWLLGARRGRTAPAVLAVAILSLAVALRYNALVLLVFLLALMAWRPRLAAGDGPARKLIVAAAIVAGLGLAWASTHWRLPDLAPMPDAGNIGGTQEFDLIGVSACADHDYLPPAFTAGQPITPYQIRQAYDERHLLLSLAPHPGAPQILQTDAGPALGRAWRDAILREPGCYLAHRAAVFVEQMGLAKGHLFYPTHGGIDPNPYGLALAHPKAAAWFAQAVDAAASRVLRRPGWLYLGAPMVGLAAAWRRRELAGLFAALLAGAFAYPALLFVAAPAADARYIFPSSVLCALVIAAGAGVLLDRAAERRP